MGKLKMLFKIYLTFLKLGSVSFGGGYAMLSLMEREVVEEKEWVDKERIIDIFAVAESLPGAIALNSSTFVGYFIKGIPGAVAALLGNLTPSVIIMVILSMLLTQFSKNPYVQSAFYGIRPVIVGLIIFAAFKIGKTAIKDAYCIVIAIISFALTIVFHFSPVTIILSGICAGILLFIVKLLLKTRAYNKHVKGGK